MSAPAPMLATPGVITDFRSETWAFEGKWDGYRMLVDANHGSTRLHARSGREVTAEFPELTSLGAGLADYHVVLDGEVVALDEAGTPSFSELQNRNRHSRVEFWAFDVLRVNRPVLRATYDDRRALLEQLANLGGVTVPSLLSGDGADAVSLSRARDWEGVVAKRRDSRYLTGQRGAAWVKQKNWAAQDVVVGGWRPGSGGALGSLLLGIPDASGLRYIGRVGSGFSDHETVRLRRILESLATDESAFGNSIPSEDASGARFVKLRLVGEVRFARWTQAGRLRDPSWRGLRPEMRVRDVVSGIAS